MSHLSVIRNFWGLLLNKNAEFKSEQEKGIHYSCEDGEKNLSLVITHHSASLVMPIVDPRDRFFYSALTLMIDSNIL